MDLYPDRYQVVFFKPNDLKPILKKGFDITNDLKILSSAIAYNKHTEILFLTNDLNELIIVCNTLRSLKVEYNRIKLNNLGGLK